MEPRVKVLIEVELERDRQVAKGYTPEHDDEHAPAEFGDFINLRVDNIQAVRGSPIPTQRPAFIQIAALAVAAIESIDRAVSLEEGSNE